MNPEQLPERCDAAEIAVVLRDVAAPGSRVVVNRPVQRWGATAVWLTSGALWRIGLWREEGAGLITTLEAVSPDRRHWQHGCERRWLEGGEVIDPLELIGERMRQQLDQRLLMAVAWPEEGLCPMWTPSNRGEGREEKQQKRGGGRKACRRA